MSNRPKPRLRKLAREHQEHFMQMVPVITAMARKAFSDRDPEAREELTSEALTHSLVMFALLIEQGREALAYAAALALFGIKRVRIGRPAATPMNVKDVSSSYCQIRKGITLHRLDRYDQDEGGWMEVLVEDKSCTPAELAATRIDFSDWLKTLSRREKKIATTLATGETTGNTARKFRVSPSRISHLRRQLKDSWETFVGDTPAPQPAVAAG